MEGEYEDSNNNLTNQKSPGTDIYSAGPSSGDPCTLPDMPIEQDEQEDLGDSGTYHDEEEDDIKMNEEDEDEEAQNSPAVSVENESFENQMVDALQRHAAQLAAAQNNLNQLNQLTGGLGQLNGLSQLNQLSQLNNLLNNATGSNAGSNALLNNLAQQWNNAALASIGGLGQALSNFAPSTSSGFASPSTSSSLVNTFSGQQLLCAPSTSGSSTGNTNSSAQNGNSNGVVELHIEPAKGYTFEEQFKQVCFFFL